MTVVSLKKSRLARMTAEERRERSAALRAYRNATKTNEMFQAQHLENLQAAVMQRVEDQILADVMTSFQDPTAATIAQIMTGIKARYEALMNDGGIAAAIHRALDTLRAERPELFSFPQVPVGPKPF